MTKSVQDSSKGKRWKRGQSSSSNPTTSKYRDAARGRFFQPMTQTTYAKPNLTVDALQKHDEKMEVSAMDTRSESGLTSISGHRPPPKRKVNKAPTVASSAASFKTWATSFTECTNTTFNSIYKVWNSDRANKEALAVLAAVTEIIKTQGGQETETEYFAVLMTTIEGAEEVETVVASAHLICIVLRKIPRSLLISKYDQISTVMINVLTKYMDNTALVMKIISCLTTILRSLDLESWNREVTKNIYNQVLTLSESSRPKIRKAVKQAVEVILRTSVCMEGSMDVHPIAALTEKYCTDRLNGLINNSLVQNSTSIASSGDITRTIQLFGGVLYCFPKSSLKNSAEIILKLMSLNNVIVKGTSLQVLNRLFLSKPSAARLTPEMNAKMIAALFDFLPNSNDVQLVPAWLLVMENAHINLASNDAALCLSHLPRFFNTCIELLRSQKKQCIVAAAVTLKAMLNGVITKVPFAEVEQQGVEPDSPIYKLFKSFETVLSYQFHSSWGYALQVISSAMKVIGKPCPHLMSSLLPTLAKLRENPELPYKAEADAAIGSAITYLGPRIVLKVLPLQVSSNSSEIERSWLMPLLTHRINDTELGFFIDHFLPLAAECQSIANTETSDGESLVPKLVYGTLVNQIWSLLPRFCTRPTDIVASFKRIAKTLGQAISDRPDLRKYVLSGIRRLISTTEGKAAMRKEIAKYAKNFLPILFNIFTTGADDFQGNMQQQMVILATIREYLEITDQEIMNDLYDKCIDKLKSDETMSTERRNALLDLAINMVHYLDDNRLRGILKFVKPLLASTERTLQKKGYRFLDTICQMKTPGTAKFVVANTSEFESLLVSNLSKSAPGTKGPRLRCLDSIFKTLDCSDSNKQFLLTVLPEAMLSVREPGSKTRAAAFELIVTFCECMIRWNGGNETSGVMEVINLMFAGLAGSPLMVVCTLHSITRVLFGYRKIFSEDNLSLMLDQACTLMQSRTKEIIVATFGLLKCVIGSFTTEALFPSLPKICNALAYIKKENRIHFRFKVKEVLIKLVKKFGHEDIIKLMPDVYQKPLNNIKKALIREKRMKAMKKDNYKRGEDDEKLLDKVKKAMPETMEEILVNSDSELEDEDEKYEREKKEQKRKAMPAWLRDDSDNITDLLDKTASQNVMVSRPSVREPIEKVEDLFKTGTDGRMVITDLEADEKALASSGRAEVDDIDKIFDQFEMEERPPKWIKKKSTYPPGENMSLASGSRYSSSTYQAGGKGIHRPLDKKKKPQPHTTGEEYKSKKAGGDAKKKNQLDPYAYVPLDMKALNRRKRAKMQGQYKGLVGGVKKGAAKSRTAGKVSKRN